MGLFRSNRVLAMDIGAAELKLAELTRGRSGIELLNIGVRSLGIEPGTDSDPSFPIISAIQDLMKERGISPGPAVISVSGQSAFMRLVKLPPVKQDKIFQTVQYEAQQNVPFPIDEVVWDYQLMGASAIELNVMLVAIKKEIVENITDCVQAVGLDVELVDVAPMALYNAVRYNYGDLPGCTLVLDIGARSTSLIFMEEGRFFSRNLPIVGAGNVITQQLMKEFNLPFKEAEELKFAHATVAFGGAYEDFSDKVISKVSKTVRSAMTRLHVEVERSINFYRTQQGGSAPNQVLLAGGSSVIARTDDFFKEKLKLSVEYINPFVNVVVNDKITEEAIGASAHVMGEAVGVGLRHFMPCPLEINLAPPKIIADRTFRKKEPYLAAAAIALVLIVVCWCFTFHTIAAKTKDRVDKVTVLVNQLEAMDARLKSLEANNQQIRKRVDELAGVAGLRTQWLRVIEEIHRHLADGMWLVSVKPIKETAVARTAGPARNNPGTDKDKAKFAHIEVKGMVFSDKANDRSISEFRDQLRKSPLFTEDTKITLAPLPTQDDFAREFTLLIALKESL